MNELNYILLLATIVTVVANNVLVVIAQSRLDKRIKKLEESK